MPTRQRKPRIPHVAPHLIRDAVATIQQAKETASMTAAASTAPASDTPDPFAADPTTDPLAAHRAGTTASTPDPLDDLAPPELEDPEEFLGGDYLKLEENKDTIFRIVTWRYAFRHQSPFGVEPKVSSFACAKDRTDRKNPVGDCIGCDAGLPVRREVAFAVLDRGDDNEAKILNLQTGGSVYTAINDMLRGVDPDFKVPDLRTQNFKVKHTKKGKRHDFSVIAGKPLDPMTEGELAAAREVLEKIVKICSAPEPGTTFYIQVSAELDEWVDAHPVKGHGKVPGADGQSDF